MAYSVRALLFAFLLIGALRHAAIAQELAQIGARQRHVVIALQDYDQDRECRALLGPGVGPCSPITQALLAIDDRTYLKRLANQYKVLTAELPRLDIPATVHAAYCEKLAAASADCAAVELLSAATRMAGEPPPSLNADTLLIRIAINFYDDAGRRGLRLIVTPQIFGASGVPAKPSFYVHYETRAPKEQRGNPLENSAGKSPEDQAVREYWFAGNPSRMELELRRGFSDTAGLMGVMLEHGADQIPDATFTAWWASLGTLKSLRDAGTLNCRGMECRSPYLAVEQSRVWYAADSNGAIVVSSVPLVDFSR